MQSRIEDGSILVISHQERIMNIADEIIVISEGQITQHGKREEVLPGLLGTASAADICDAFCQGGAKRC